MEFSLHISKPFVKSTNFQIQIGIHPPFVCYFDLKNNNQFSVIQLNVISDFLRREENQEMTLQRKDNQRRKSSKKCPLCNKLTSASVKLHTIICRNQPLVPIPFSEELGWTTRGRLSRNLLEPQYCFFANKKFGIEFYGSNHPTKPFIIEVYARGAYCDASYILKIKPKAAKSTIVIHGRLNGSSKKVRMPQSKIDQDLVKYEIIFKNMSEAQR